MPETTSSADELLRALILKRFGETYERLPYSREFHLLHCDTLEVADFSHRQTFSCCESCPHVEFTALVWCEHVQLEWSWAEAGHLGGIIADMAELAEAASDA